MNSITELLLQNLSFLLIQLFKNKLILQRVDNAPILGVPYDVLTDLGTNRATENFA
jgi:hypothetical protein